MITYCLESFVLIKSFIFCSFDSFLLYSCLDLLDGLEGRTQWLAVIKFHWLLATRAVQEAKDDSRRSPLVFNDLFDAVEMEDMPTSKPDTWFGAETGYPTDLAVCILIYSFIQETLVVWSSCCFRLLALLCNAFSVKTRKTLLLSIETPAWMTTRECFSTVCIL